MSLRKPINLKWRDKEFSIVVTMEIIERLEDHINLSKLVQRTAVGDVRLSHAAKLIWLLLIQAGAKCEYEEVYAEMHGLGDMKPKDVGALLREIFSAIFPQPRKKSSSTGAKKKRTSKKVKVTRGKSNTK